jgi:large repetitive protein
MPSLVTRSFRAPAARRRNRTQLALEELDGRYCPAGPVITNFTATVISGSTVCLSGTVTDPGSSAISISFTGPVGGTVTADGTNGNFSYTANASGSGTEQATATDDKAQVSPPVQTQITLNTGSGSGSGSGSSPGSGSSSGSSPVSITLSVINVGRNLVSLYGQVTDASAGGLTVSLSGVVSGSTTTNADGSFNVNLPASAVGQVTAAVTDGAGNTATATATVRDDAPVIQNFYASQQGSGTWVLSGSVEANSPAGLTVQFGGPSWLQGQSATVNPDATFSLTITPPAGQEVSISAQCTDWFGLQSNIAYDTFQT